MFTTEFDIVASIMLVVLFLAAWFVSEDGLVLVPVIVVVAACVRVKLRTFAGLLCHIETLALQMKIAEISHRIMNWEKSLCVGDFDWAAMAKK